MALSIGKSSLALVLATGVAAALAFACGTTTTTYVDVDEEEDAGSGFDSQPQSDSGLGVLTFMPEESFSGFDGTHTFKVPIAVYDSADDLEVTATDTSAATVEAVELKNPVRNDGTADNGKYFLITVKKAGTITLEATSKGRTVESKITVAEYAPTRWAVGESRYNNGSSEDPPCTECHVNGEAIDHSPAALATATDEDIRAVITTGISTAGFPIKLGNGGSHKWTVTDTESEGLVTFLRGIEPKGFK